MQLLHLSLMCLVSCALLSLTTAGHHGGGFGFGGPVGILLGVGLLAKLLEGNGHSHHQHHHHVHPVYVPIPVKHHGHKHHGSYGGYY